MLSGRPIDRTPEIAVAMLLGCLLPPVVPISNGRGAERGGIPIGSSEICSKGDGVTITCGLQ